ncbi:MAG: hypothetical protein K8T91_06750 [Planctomycetes bacterium]|nr:hypothetical protein [Planctomycetota bacterium]
MDNRLKHVLRLVTLFHPEHYLGCKSVELISNPHHVRPRKKSHERRKVQNVKYGFPIKSQIMDDGTEREGSGDAVERYRDKSIRGALLDAFVNGMYGALAVLIYVPDEIRKAKWRCELRTLEDWRIQLQDQYPEGFDSLPETVRLRDEDFNILWKNVRESSLRVCGFWVNPSHSLNFPGGKDINIVLGPIKGRQLSPATFRAIPDAGRCWIEYSEDVKH